MEPGLSSPPPEIGVEPARGRRRAVRTDPAALAPLPAGAPHAAVLKAGRPPLLIIDDDDLSRATLSARLELLGYRVYGVTTGARALEILDEREVALVLFSAGVADMKGDEILEHRRSASRLSAIPFVVIAGPADTAGVARCIELGAEDYVTKPFDTFLLQARIGACLERKRLLDLESAYQAVVQSQAGELAQLNLVLADRQQQQVGESERLARLRRFLSPQLAELISSSGDESVLESHRREITVAFCDLRGYTAFVDSAEPEDVMGVIREYHAAMGEIIFAHDGTLERFTGDGMMVFFNDPVPLPDPTGQAVRMAVAMRERAAHLADRWRNRGYELGLGIGIAMGYATLGRIGFEGRFDYGAVGAVTNLASRLCDEAAPGQILVGRRVWSAVEGIVEVEPVGRLQLKGFQRPVEAFNVLGLKGGPR